MLRKLPLLGLALLATFILFAGVASAQTFKNSQNTTVSGTETIESAAYLFGNTVDIAGTVNGDVYCAGQTVNISGTVNGNIFCAGQTVNFSGTASGSIRLAGQTVNVSGKTTSATIMAQTTSLSNNAQITQDFNGGSATLTVAQQATIGRDLTYGASNIVINGNVGRNIKANTENLTLGNGAQVGGNIDYTSLNDINKAANATVGGTINKSIPQEKSKTTYSFDIVGSLIFAFYFFVSCLLVLMVLALLFSGVYKESAVRVSKSPLLTLLIGLVALFAVPIILLFIAITLIGIPLAIVLGLIWLVILLLSGSFSSYYLGTLVLKKQKNSLLIMLTGGSIVLVVCLIPIIGFFVYILVTMFGTGAALQELTRRTSIV